MKVRVAYTVMVADDYRRAIRHHFGQAGLATRAEVKRWLEQNGSQADDDLMWALAQAETLGDAGAALDGFGSEAGEGESESA